MPVSRETADRVVSVLELAAEANRTVSARQGNLIEVTRGVADDVMITADLHGDRLNFERLLKLADLDHHPRRHLVMQEVCHGGPSYPASGGCMSHLLLEDVADLCVRYKERFHFLLGNHEVAELTDFPITKSSRMLNLTFRCGTQEFYGREAERVRHAQLDFLESCPLAARVDEGVFVSHSVPENVVEQGFAADVFERRLKPEDLAPGGAVFRLVWGRDFRENNAAEFARLVDASVLINGHEPCEGGYYVPNRYQIILDCCGPRIGYLTLPTGRRWTLDQVVPLIRETE
jgi:hypothetical protein